MANTPPRSRRQPGWANWSDEQLLSLRLCDLHLEIDDCPTLVENIDRLGEDFSRRGIEHFRPHCWLSSEWFSPDGIPGIAIPFYLAHPRLTKLERSQMLTVEGGSTRQCMQILRHEAGHAICNAFRLNRRKSFRDSFGPSTRKYPESYKPNPASRHYVTHLPAWYAQAHPAEDFAETFAVWLTPGSRWRKTYAGWPAIRKLELIDEWMREVGDKKPPVRTHRRIEPLSTLKTTLAEHYRRKRWFYADTFPDFYDRDLRKLFSADPKHARRPTAASFLRKIRPEIRDTVAAWTGTHAYTIDQVLRDMIDRCKELKLRLAVPEAQAKRDAALMVTVQTMNYIHAGHHPVAL